MTDIIVFCFIWLQIFRFGGLQFVVFFYISSIIFSHRHLSVGLRTRLIGSKNARLRWEEDLSVFWCVLCFYCFVIWSRIDLVKILMLWWWYCRKWSFYTNIPQSWVNFSACCLFFEINISFSINVLSFVSNVRKKPPVCVTMTELRRGRLDKVKSPEVEVAVGPIKLVLTMLVRGVCGCLCVF